MVARTGRRQLGAPEERAPGVEGAGGLEHPWDRGAPPQREPHGQGGADEVAVDDIGSDVIHEAAHSGTDRPEFPRPADREVEVHAVHRGSACLETISDRPARRDGDVDVDARLDELAGLANRPRAAPRGLDQVEGSDARPLFSSHASVADLTWA